MGHDVCHASLGASARQIKPVGKSSLVFGPITSAGRAAQPIRPATMSETGATLSLFAAGVVVFVLFVASYSRRDTWLALCSMPMSMALVLGCLFLSTAHDHSQVRIWFAWAASKVPLVFDRQIADDLGAASEPLATSPRCDPARPDSSEH